MMYFFRQAIFLLTAVQVVATTSEVVHVGVWCYSNIEGTEHKTNYEMWPLLSRLVFPKMNVYGLFVGSRQFEFAPVLYAHGSVLGLIREASWYQQTLFDKMIAGLDMFNNTVNITFLVSAVVDQLSITIPMVHANQMPTMFLHANGLIRSFWKVENDWEFALTFTFVHTAEGPNRIVRSLNLNTLLLNRSPFGPAITNRMCGIFNVIWQERLELIGPTVHWCNNWAHTHVSCGVSSSNVCTCALITPFIASQIDNDDSHLDYTVTHATHYCVNDAYAGWTAFILSPLKIEAFQATLIDGREQSNIDVHHNMHYDFWDLVYSSWVEQWLPVYSVVHPVFDVTAGFTEIPWMNETMAMTEVHGYWFSSFGVWHATLRYPDPVFGSNQGAGVAHIAEFGEVFNKEDAVTMALAALTKFTFEKHLPETWPDQPLVTKRRAIQWALSDMYDNCMWGPVRFDRLGLNNGRSGAAWQIFYEDGSSFDGCILPLLAAVRPIFYPQPTWNARLGCPKGQYNGGYACHPCPAGSISTTVSPGLLFGSSSEEQCSLCKSGTGTEYEGQYECSKCPSGKSQNADRDGGRCRDCAVGYYRGLPLEESVETDDSLECALCLTGYFTAVPGMSECTSCPRGRYQNHQGKSECQLCERGFFTDKTRQSSCDRCLLGAYQDETESVTCKSCTATYPGATTFYPGATSDMECQCPTDKYNVKNYGRRENKCVDCPVGIKCPGFEKANQPPELMKSGYYSKRLMPLQLLNGVWLCMSNEACIGQKSPGDAFCQDRRYGLNCGLCEDNFANSGGPGGKCYKCAGEAAIIPVTLMFFFLIIGFFNFLWNERERLVEAAEPVLASVTFDVALSFLQSLGIFDKMSFDWPPEFRSILNLSKLFLFDVEILKPGCLYPQSLAANYLSRLALPLILCGLFFLWFPITYVLNIVTAKRVPIFKMSGMMNTTGMIVSALYISLVCSSVSLLECYESPNGRTALRTYPYVECGLPEQLAMMPFLILSLLVYVVGVFSLFIWLCHVAPLKLQNVFFQKATRFLVFQMQPSTWWYSVILLLRSALLALVPVFEASDGFVQILIFNLVLIVSLISHMTLLPFADQRANRLEIFDVFLLLVMLYIGSYFVFRDVDYNPQFSWTLSVVLCTCVGLCGVAISCFMCLGFRDSFAQKGARARDEVIIRKALSAIRAMCAIMQAADDEQVLRMLRFASYVDRWHFDMAVNHTLLELCGLQGKSMSNRRLSKTTANITTATEEKIAASHEKASKQLAKSLSGSLPAESPEVWV